MAMYPPLKQSGYETDSAYEWGRSAGWPEPWPQAQHGPQASRFARTARSEPGPEVVWPPPGRRAALPALHHAHIAPVAPKARAWPRVVLALAFTFAGGVAARPFLEAQARALPGALQVVGHALLDQMPSWVQAQFTPEVPALAPQPPPQHVVTTPLPTPPSEPLPGPEAADEAIAVAEVPVETAEVNAEPAEAPPPEAAAEADPMPPTHGRSRRSASRRRASRAKAVAVATPAAPRAEPRVQPAPAPVALAPSRKSAPADSLDSLMARAVQEPDPSEAQAPATPDAAARPGLLGREQIVTIMKGLLGDVNACGAGLARPTNADLTLTVTPAGSVSAVKLDGPLFATLAAGCVVRVVKGASFPASKGMTFSYRYTLRPGPRSSSAASEMVRPERITGSAQVGQAPPVAASVPRLQVDEQVLPKLPSKVTVSDDPLAGLGGRAVEGKRQSSARARR